MKNMLNKNKGITLIALVITIIVLLILAGVAIATLTGENGLLNRATGAKDVTKREELIDRVKLDILNNEVGKKMGEEDKLHDVLDKYFTNVPDDLTNADLKTTVLVAKSAYGGFDDITLGEVLGNTVASNPPAGGTRLKVGDTDLSTVSDISTMYGQTTDYKSTSHPNIDWQLFYADSNNYYVIASDYVPNAELPCNGNTGYGITDLVKRNGANGSYNASFCTNSNYNDGVLTAGTIYKNGSASTAITSNPLTNAYLKWVTNDSYKTNTNNNICSVAYMMDTNKWSSFADGVSGAYAIGGPTLELFVNSYNAISRHTTKLGTYEIVDSNNSNSNGYMTKIGTGSWTSYVSGLDTSGADGNMWVRTSQKKAYGYCLASPSSGNANCVRFVFYDGFVTNGNAYNESSGFRPVVCIPK